MSRYTRALSGNTRTVQPVAVTSGKTAGTTAGKVEQLPLVPGMAPVPVTPTATQATEASAVQPATPDPPPASEPLDPRPELPGHEIWETVLQNAMAMFGDGMVLANLKGQRSVETRLVQREDGKAPYFRLEPTRRDETAKWGETKRTYLEPIREHVLKVFEASSWGRVVGDGEAGTALGGVGVHT